MLALEIEVIDADRIDDSEVLYRTSERVNAIYKSLKIVPNIGDSIFVQEKGILYKIIEKNYDTGLSIIKCYLGEDILKDGLKITLVVRDELALIEFAEELRAGLDYETLKTISYWYDGYSKVFITKRLSLIQLNAIRKYYNSKVEYYRSYREHNQTLPDFFADDWDVIDDAIGELLAIIKRREKSNFSYWNLYEEDICTGKGTLFNDDELLE